MFAEGKRKAAVKRLFCLWWFVKGLGLFIGNRFQAWWCSCCDATLVSVEGADHGKKQCHNRGNAFIAGPKLKRISAQEKILRHSYT
jgi:hypothetical protein